MLKFEIKTKMKTANELKRIHNSPSGKGWAMYRAYKAKLATLLLNSLVGGSNNAAFNSGRPRVKRTVNLLYITVKLQDIDNFYASLKPLLDAMVDLHLIRDDNDKSLRLLAKQKQQKDSKKYDAYTTIIEVY